MRIELISEDVYNFVEVISEYETSVLTVKLRGRTLASIQEKINIYQLYIERMPEPWLQMRCASIQNSDAQPLSYAAIDGCNDCSLSTYTCIFQSMVVLKHSRPFTTCSYSSRQR
jgi:hypothetical protein